MSSQPEYAVKLLTNFNRKGLDMSLEAHLGTLLGSTCSHEGCTVGLLAPEAKTDWLCDSHRPCPRCGDSDMEFPALSRTDNKTKVCSQCGRIEGIEHLVMGTPLPQEYWAVND